MTSQGVCDLPADARHALFPWRLTADEYRLRKRRWQKSSLRREMRRAIDAGEIDRCTECLALSWVLGGPAILVIDHIWPLVKGGTSDPENLQVLCDPCNLRKGDRPL